MKKIIGLIAVCFLVTACESPIETFVPEFHRVATIACEKNDGYEKLRVWTDYFKAMSNEHLVVVCNDRAEMFLVRWETLVDETWMFGEWKPDSVRFGTWE